MSYAIRDGVLEVGSVILFPFFLNFLWWVFLISWIEYWVIFDILKRILHWFKKISYTKSESVLDVGFIIFFPFFYDFLKWVFLISWIGNWCIFDFLKGFFCIDSKGSTKLLEMVFWYIFFSWFLEITFLDILSSELSYPWFLVRNLVWNKDLLCYKRWCFRGGFQGFILFLLIFPSWFLSLIFSFLIFWNGFTSSLGVGIGLSLISFLEMGL